MVAAQRLAVAALAGTAAALLVVVSASPYAAYFQHEFQPGSVLGQLAALALFLAGWTLMVLAMMLPTATGLLSAVARFDRAWRVRALVGCGFVAVWLVVGYAFRAGDILVHDVVDAIGWLEERPQLLGAAALTVAGLFQFTPLKHRCLTACRSPASFVYRYWRGESATRDALRVGGAYGVSCVGCCWALMLVLFGLGTANVAWMLCAGAVMAAEKNARIGPRLSTPLGVTLLAGAAVWAIG